MHFFIYKRVPINLPWFPIRPSNLPLKGNSFTRFSHFTVYFLNLKFALLSTWVLSSYPHLNPTCRRVQIRLLLDQSPRGISTAFYGSWNESRDVQSGTVRFYYCMVDICHRIINVKSFRSNWRMCSEMSLTPFSVLFCWFFVSSLELILWDDRSNRQKDATKN